MQTSVSKVSGVKNYQLHGSGTTNPSKFFWKVMDIMEEQAKVPLFMTYPAVGSSTGQTEFTGTAANSHEPLNHFGAGDIPMTKARYDEINPVASAPSKMLHIPFLVGPIAVFHSVPAGELPAGGIELDACLLSKILRRVITTWDDPAIKALNPTLKVSAGQAIKVAHRTLGSSSTAGITEYLAKATKDRCESKLSSPIGSACLCQSPGHSFFHLDCARTSITRQRGVKWMELAGLSSAFHYALSLFNWCFFSTCGADWTPHL